MPKIQCVEDVYIINQDREKDVGKPSFIKGNIYRSYKWNMPDGYGFKPVLCAKNEFGNRHIIRDEQNEEFYNKHFISVK